MQTNRKTVVISGASTGIGFAMAKQLGEMGYLVFAGARKEDDIAHLTEIENVQGVKLDITNLQDITLLTRHIETHIGYIDVLVNNAGIPGWGAIMDRDVAYFKRVMDVNLFGHVQMVKSFYPLLEKSNSSPIIINISSQAGNYAFPFWAPYHMSKWALEAFSDCLRRELLPHGIRVAVIQPGAIKSEAFEKQRNDFLEYKSKSMSEFHFHATAFLQKAFERPPDKAKDPQVVVNALLHAINHHNNKLYYQPGRRFIPDILVAKLPRKWVDWFLTRVGKINATS